MKIKATLFIICTVLIGCSKDNSPNVTLNATLTNCPANTTCTYSYYEHADYIGPNQFVNGNNRIFAYNSVNKNLCGATSEFYLKIPLNSNSFIINSSQIASGEVTAYNFICPCCDYALVSKPIGGEIKGKKADSSHWLINATVLFGNPGNNTPTDTLIVNQYFTLEKVPSYKND